MKRRKAGSKGPDAQQLARDRAADVLDAPRVETLERSLAEAQRVIKAQISTMHGMQARAAAAGARALRDEIDRDRVTGMLLVEWRIARGLSQQELGKRLRRPLDGAQISVYERSKASPTVWQLLNVIGGLGIPGTTERERLRAFFGGPEMRKTEEVTTTTSTDDVASLSPVIRRVIMNTVAEVLTQLAKPGGRS